MYGRDNRRLGPGSASFSAGSQGSGHGCIGQETTTYARTRSPFVHGAGLPRHHPRSVGAGAVSPPAVDQPARGRCARGWARPRHAGRDRAVRGHRLRPGLGCAAAAWGTHHRPGGAPQGAGGRPVGVCRRLAAGQHRLDGRGDHRRPSRPGAWRRLRRPGGVVHAHHHLRRGAAARPRAGRLRCRHRGRCRDRCGRQRAVDRGVRVAPASP